MRSPNSFLGSVHLVEFRVPFTVAATVIISNLGTVAYNGTGWSLGMAGRANVALIAIC